MTARGRAASNTCRPCVGPGAARRAFLAMSVMLSGIACAAAPRAGMPIALRPAGSEGIFDPSLADTPRGRRAWMSFSSVDPSPRWPTENTRTVTTRLAYSDDRGASWTDVGFAINGICETAGGADARTWVNEVSSLVYDRFAPEAARWKLFWHHYLYLDGRGSFQNGWIAYKAASTPQGLRDATEVKLFAGRGYDAANDRRFGTTGSPLAGSPLVRLNELDKDLNPCIAASEPSVIATLSGLYLSLSCYGPKGFPLFAMLTGAAEPVVVLLKCDAPCRPQRAGSWRYIATLLRPQDARGTGANHYSASDLFVVGDRSYIVSSPVANVPVHGSYHGCRVFGFTDIAAGRLESDGTGPKILKTIEGEPGSFNGACTYSQAATASGFMYGQITFEAGRPHFQIFQTTDTM